MASTAGPIFSAAEIAQFREETRGCRHVNHLNNAGAGLMPDRVTNAVIDYLELESEIGGYEAAALKQAAIGEFYGQAALLFNCKPANIAFTASATDSFTRALSSIPFAAGDVILTDRDGYISNQIQFLSFQKRFGIKIVHLNNSPMGGIDCGDLEEKIHALRPRLLAITHIPTNSGLIQPVKKIGEIVRSCQERYPESLWYILDACQSAGQLPLDVSVLHCDFLSITNRKFLRGPRGAGALYVSERALGAGLEPLFIDMRGAEWVDKDHYRPRPDAARFEDWEFAYCAVIGSSEAIRYCRNIGESRISQQVKFLSDRMRLGLKMIDRVEVLDRGPELGGLVTFTVKGSQPGLLLDELRVRKINVVPSFRGFAVIDFDEKQVQWAIRASPHYYNTVDEINEFTDAVRSIIKSKP